MVTVEIEGFLLQRKLDLALRKIVGESWSGAEVKVGGTRYRWDMTYTRFGQTVAVEFDGDEHYRDTRKIRVDRIKDEIAHENGYSVVRFPYWIQLTTETLWHYFGLQANVIQSFPHGFIDSRAKLPASFCELGIERFKDEMAWLSDDVRNRVLDSLADWCAKYEKHYVVPSELSDWI
ncbi:hypothetical protein ACNSTU_07235 [Aquisalimonas sp. APHAB1-3]|uniref:hypothetical protein n=1 Tax=Aquisalimonas sp. APHAB1-3 TaxID=3402080 RepID=UPI003AAF8BDC